MIVASTEVSPEVSTMEALPLPPEGELVVTLTFVAVTVTVLSDCSLSGVISRASSVLKAKKSSFPGPYE
jgi:hypothetical protein